MWRSGYYEVVLEIDVGDKLRRDYAFFVVRPAAGARIVLALATNTWHAYNDFGGTNLYTGGTQVALRRPMAPGYLYKPPGKGRRVTGTGAPDPQNAAHVGYLHSTTSLATPARRGGPTGSSRSSSGPSARASRSACARTPTWRRTQRCWTGRASTSRSATTSTGPEGMRDTVEAFVAGGGNAAFFCGNTSLWQVRLEGATTTSWSATRASSRTTR